MDQKKPLDGPFQTRAGSAFNILFDTRLLRWEWWVWAVILLVLMPILILFTALDLHDSIHTLEQYQNQEVAFSIAFRPLFVILRMLVVIVILIFPWAAINRRRIEKRLRAAQPVEIFCGPH